MTDITLTDKQSAAISAIKDWFLNRTKEQRIYRLFGYAGTGKSTILKYALQELNLSMDGVTPDVVVCCFTGKAVMVLRKKNTPARTIHSTIYAVSEASDDEFAKVHDQIREIEKSMSGISGIDRITLDAMLKQKHQDLRDMKKPRFGLNDQSVIRDCKLVVLDECSQVGPDLAADIMSFGKPVLVLGDPGQLPPIRGEGYFTQATPDILLTEIHRQAQDSAIIRLATMARNGQYIPFGQHSELVWKMRQRDVEPEMLNHADVVATGMNATRLMLNNAMRRAHGRSTTIPLPEDRIMCLRNDNENGLINGMFLKLSEIEERDDMCFSAMIHTEDDEPIGPPRKDGTHRKFDIYTGHFLDHVMMDPDRNDRDWKIKKRLVECTFGNSATTYKLQGSGFRNIVYWDDGFGRTREMRCMQNYTAITRAEEGLLIAE